MISVGVVMVAYGAEPLLHDAVTSVLASNSVDPEVVVVDNGADPDVIDRVRFLPGVMVVSPGEDLGFAAGCNLGAATTLAEVVVLCGCAVTVRPDALRRLTDALDDPGVGIATANVRMTDDVKGPVSSVSSACCAIRREVWDELGGLDEADFAHHQDVGSALHRWQRDRTIVHVPDSIAWHHNGSQPGPTRSDPLERNRLLTILTTHRGSRWYRKEIFSRL